MRQREAPLDAIEELEQSVKQLKVVADMMVQVAYHGYRSEAAEIPGVVGSSGQKHGMIGGGVSVKDARVHRELERMSDEVGRKAAELKMIAGKYCRAIYEKDPGEPVTQEMLDNLEEWEKRRNR